jgi:hypothetical protein
MKKKIALVCIAKLEDLYIQEWIDYHLKLGFNDIHIFQNDWRFEKQIPNEHVYFHEYDGKTHKNSEPIWVRNIQAKCYTDFLRKYSDEYEWAAFFDVDEFLVLKKTNDVKEFIKDYDNYDCLVINWAAFGDNGITNFDEKNTSVINRFTKRKALPLPQFKSICKLGINVEHQIHYTTSSWVDTNFKIGNEPYNYDGNFNVAQLNHYFTKTLPEFINKRERGNACGCGVDGKRDISDFYENNYNEVDDTLAKDFYK